MKQGPPVGGPCFHLQLAVARSTCLRSVPRHLAVLCAGRSLCTSGMHMDPPGCMASYQAWRGPKAASASMCPSQPPTSGTSPVSTLRRCCESTLSGWERAIRPHLSLCTSCERSRSSGGLHEPHHLPDAMVFIGEHVRSSRQVMRTERPQTIAALPQNGYQLTGCIVHVQLPRIRREYKAL